MDKPSSEKAERGRQVQRAAIEVSEPGADAGPSDDSPMGTHHRVENTARRPPGIMRGMSKSIRFLGAARTVTGSKHLLTLGKRQILVDCGLFQGPRDLRELNWQPFAFDPVRLDAVVLTHAHADHIGMLPRLVRQGYRGPVYATPSTIAISRISLPDSARLLEEEAEYHRRHGTSRHADPRPLYTESDAFEALKLFRPVRFWQPHPLPGKAQFRFMPAGHILGSAFVEVTFDTGETLLLSGDVGRPDRPLLKDPTRVDHADSLVLESTYGDRIHSDQDADEVLQRVAGQAVAHRSCIVVPSFAIGRTQELLWRLGRLADQGRLPHIPVYIDSPMATATTLLYVEDSEDLDQELRVDLREGRSPFQKDFVRFVRDRSMSKALNDMDGPMMVISGSGMATGGRVVHHLKRRLGDPSSIVLFTGYQAEGTLGRQIVDGAEEVTVLGERVSVRCQVEKLDALSAHADSDELVDWCRGFKSSPRRTFLVHGEPPAQEALKGRLERELGWTVSVPAPGEAADL
jgi:metallo-beta-lactamase family protein